MPSRAQLRAPANDFRAQWEDLGADALAAVDRVGRSGWLVLGEEVRAFEAALATFWGVPHAVGVASGLDALEIALRCAGIGPGDRVLTTPLTAYATTLAVQRAGADPVWCDVDATGGLDLEQADEALAADTRIRAVLPVHLYGHPLDPAGLQQLADRHHDVTVIEDCAQSAGARRDGRPTGTVGLAAGTSFYPTKNLGALGDGGAVLTASDAIAAQARTLRDYGQDRRYHHVEPGLNSRLDEVHAAVLREAMLPRLDGFLRRRAEIARRYDEGLAGTAVRPVGPAAGDSAHHLYPVVPAQGDPEALRAHLADAGIAAGRHYPVIGPDQPAAGGIGAVYGDLATARRLAEAETSLPIHPYLADDGVEAVLEACRGWAP